MAFSTISSLAIAVGAAIKKELWDKVKGNLDDHETRLNSVETIAKKEEVIKFYVQNGTSFSTATGIYYYEADVAFTLTNAYIRIFEVGSLAGEIEIDIKKSTTDMDSASFTTVFTTKPSVDLDTASDYDSSVNQVFDNGQVSIAVGDFLRFDITQTPTSGVMGRFLISVYGEI